MKMKRIDNKIEIYHTLEGVRANASDLSARALKMVLCQF